MPHDLRSKTPSLSTVSADCPANRDRLVTVFRRGAVAAALGVIAILTGVLTTVGGCDSAPVSHGSGGQSGNGGGGQAQGGGSGGQAGAVGGGGGVVGSGGGAAGAGGSGGVAGAGGATDCPTATFPTGGMCTPPSDGTCWHDPLPYTCDRTTGRWVCPFGAVPAPPHACGGAGGGAAGAGGGAGPGGGGGGLAGAGGRGGAGGSAPATVWSSDAAKAVVEDIGGGFVGPPPAGSECGYGVGSYTFTVADDKLVWHFCDTAQTPFKYVDGARVLNASERMMLLDALEAVVISTKNLCGADKSTRLLTVTRPSGPVTYRDSFYSCLNQGIYVDSIDSVFSVASTLAK